MHNLKEIRKDFDAFIESLKSRSIDIEFDKIESTRYCRQLARRVRGLLLGNGR